MFPLLRASPSLSIGQRDQATDGWMRTIAPPRDTASVFFHCSPRWSSPSSRPEHDLENLQAFDETMRPRRYLERNRDCVRTDFAPGRPPPVHPRLTGACAAMRGFQICVSGHAQMQRPPSAWTALRSRFTMSNSPPRDLSTQHVSFPRRISAPGLVRPSRFLRHLHRISAAFAGASAGSRPNPWRQLQLRPRNEGAGGAPGGALPRLSRS